MTFLLWLAAVFCVIYYLVILFWSGIATSFSLVWPVLAALCIAFSAGLEAYPQHKEKIPLWLPVSTLTLCISAVLVFLIVEVLVFAGSISPEPPNLDYLIVLGARVKENGISRSLKMRLDKALTYLEDNPDTVLVLSGGQGSDEPASEAQAMQEYLMACGVEEQKLLLETRSFSTVENLVYSRLVIEEDLEKKKTLRQNSPVYMEPGTYEEIPDKPLKVGVLTSNFHLFRAKEIGKKWAFADISGIAAPSDPVLFLHYCIRECAAILKDKLMGNL